MQPFLWFLLTLLLAIVYAWRLRRVIGYVQVPLVQWWVAAALAAGLIIGTLLSVRFDISVERDVGVFLQGVTLFACSFVALRYWTSWRPWDIPAAFIAVLAVAFYYAEPRTFNNVVLCLASLGIGAGGYFLTKRALRAFIVVMAFFDAYAVWGSNIMEQLSLDSSFAPFPGSLLVGMAIAHIGVGTLDVALGAMVTVGVQRHRGTARAAGFVTACAGALLVIALAVDPLARMGSTWLTQVPFLVVLAPLTLVFLKRNTTPPSC